MDFFREMISLTAITFTFGILLFQFGVKLAPKIANLTTIGNQLWFGNVISSITSKIKNNTLSNLITRLSYNKLFVCNACHTFWLTVMTGTFMNIFLYNDWILFFLVQLLLVTPSSLIAFHLEQLNSNDD